MCPLEPPGGHPNAVDTSLALQFVPERSAWVIPKLPMTSRAVAARKREARCAPSRSQRLPCPVTPVQCSAARAQSISVEVFDQSDTWLESAFVRRAEARARFALYIPMPSVYLFTLGACKCA